MPDRSIVVAGASAGGVEALKEFVAALPAGLPAAFAVVVHTAAGSATFMPRILERAGPMPAGVPMDGEPVRAGTIAIAPGGRHLVVVEGTYHLTRGPRENGHRPAIDPLFRSAARAYGPRAIGLLFSGADDDGTEGLLMIKARGGVAIAQDPKTALFERMPSSAIRQVAVDAVLPPREMGLEVGRLLTASADSAGAERGDDLMCAAGDPGDEIERFDHQIEAWNEGRAPDVSTGLTCPLCGGGIWSSPEGHLSRYRCQTGHAFSPESLAREQAELLETTLWNAVRVLRERAALLRRLGQEQTAQVEDGRSQRYLEQATEPDRGVAALRELMQGVEANEERHIA